MALEKMKNEVLKTVVLSKVLFTFCFFKNSKNSLHLPRKLKEKSDSF